AERGLGGFAHAGHRGADRRAHRQVIANQRRESRPGPNRLAMPAITNSVPPKPVLSTRGRAAEGVVVCDSGIRSPWLPWDACYQPTALQLENHAVHAGWSDAEEALQVGLGGRTAVDQRISVDESEILALRGTKEKPSQHVASSTLMKYLHQAISALHKSKAIPK